MVKLLLERGALPNQHANVLGVMSVWQLFLLDIYVREMNDRAGAWEVAQLLLRYKADPQAKVPVEQTTSNVVVKLNPQENCQDVTLERRATRHASVENCLSRIERHDRVRELLSNLPVSSNAGFWGNWKPWFL
jgi:hypothetical protein